MKLYLARHGEYRIDDVIAGNPLSEQGKAAIAALAQFLQPLHMEVDAIWHSGKLRAKQTAELLSKAFICQQAIQEQPGLNPLDDVDEFAHHLHLWEENDLLLVGHMPFMSRLIAKLLVQAEDKELVRFQPGTLVCLEKNAGTDWVIHWVLGPFLTNLFAEHS